MLNRELNVFPGGLIIEDDLRALEFIFSDLRDSGFLFQWLIVGDHLISCIVLTKLSLMQSSRRELGALR
jgi:hypothetical protein